MHCIVLHCIALHCIALYCIALHCIALHCIALHCIALHCIVSNFDNIFEIEHWPGYMIYYIMHTLLNAVILLEVLQACMYVGLLGWYKLRSLTLYCNRWERKKYASLCLRQRQDVDQNVDVMMVQRLWRWPNISSTLVKCLHLLC